jgi:hypothetical protein
MVEEAALLTILTLESKDLPAMKLRSHIIIQHLRRTKEVLLGDTSI